MATERVYRAVSEEKYQQASPPARSRWSHKDVKGSILPTRSKLPSDSGKRCLVSDASPSLKRMCPRKLRACTAGRTWMDSGLPGFSISTTWLGYDPGPMEGRSHDQPAGTNYLAGARRGRTTRPAVRAAVRCAG